MYKYRWSSQVVLVVKIPPASPGHVRDTGSTPGSGRSHGGGHGNPLQYSCLENPHEQRNLAGCSSWGCKESDMTEQLNTHTITTCKFHVMERINPFIWRLTSIGSKFIVQPNLSF